MSDDVDSVLRHVSRQFPEDLAKALLPGARRIEVTGWSDTQVTGRQRRLDRSLEVRADDSRIVLHVEWAGAHERDHPFRMYEYHTLFAAVLYAETPLGDPVPTIRSTLVLLGGREAAWPERGEYRTSPPGEPFSGVTFVIDPVYQRRVSELEARGSLFWLGFTPLAVDADRMGMARVVGRLRQEARSRRQFVELAELLVVMAEVDQRGRGLREEIVSLLTSEDVMQSWLFKEGEKRGTDHGLSPVVRLFERKLGRPLSDLERNALRDRLARVGPERLGDAVLDLDASELATWLEDPGAP